ncbi:MAG: efflux RND transporter permease subunit, partial [Steroidobacteraceae bacterium]
AIAGVDEMTSSSSVGSARIVLVFDLSRDIHGAESDVQSAIEAALLRFRPILMTTVAALFAALPLMLGTGTGSEVRSPLGLSITGGLLLSQLLTLFTTPVIYLYFDQLARRAKAWAHGREERGPPALPAGSRG